MKLILGVIIVTVLIAGDSEACGSTWRAAGRSWREGGRELFDAIGKSIGGDADKNQEWREVGEGFKAAGKNTAKALEKSVAPDEPSSSKDK